MVAKNAKAGTRVKNPVKQQAPSETKKIASIVEQGPNDKLARLDGYGETKAVPTSFYDSMSKYTDSLFDSMQGMIPDLTKFDLKSLKGLKDFANEVAKFDPNELKKRIEKDVLGGRSFESLMDLPNQIKKDAVGTLTNLVGDTKIGGLDVKNIIQAAGSSYKDAMAMYNLVQNGDWKSFNGIVNSLQNVLGGVARTPLGDMLNKFVDIQATSAFIGSLARYAMKIGHSPLVQKISELFQNKRHGREAFNAGVYGAAVNSDLSMLDILIGFNGSDNIMTNNPLAIRWILSHYKIDGLYTSDKIVEYRNRLIDILDRLDANWDKTIQHGVVVTKLEPFNWATKDALQLLKYEDPNSDRNYLTECLIAKSYPTQDMKQMVMKLYKDIAFKDRPFDPRIRR